MDNTDLYELIESQEEKYTSLLWYARKPSADSIADVWTYLSMNTIEAIIKEKEIIENSFPEETSALNSAESGDWQHGFNSGMVAALRVVLVALDPENQEDPMEDFPNLDS